ncbi:Endothelin-converting enzyme 1 [Choanephora cucurbitarum]|uniref:Endothelin-converting enzyme 1 n=1 Tax=Choanephora cucurbitarum TaxID=101091 RepID=A0A1C7NL12_9FUNG|nr:Endothelin-converting enzyme 1 [Choanephora cucurbitarum]
MIGSLLPNSLSVHSSQLLARAETCTTQVCKDASKSILNDLDLNADPCSDFYQYTCGGWSKVNRIPDAESGTFAVLRNKNLDDLTHMLESNYDSLIENLKTAKVNSTDFLNSTQIAKDRENFNKIKDFYQSCINEPAIDSLGPTPIYPEIATMLKKLGYNASVADGRFSLDYAKQLTDALIHLGKEGIYPLFSSGVGPDDRTPEQNSVSIAQPSLGLPSREYYEQPEALSNYREGLTSLLTLILGEPAENDPLASVRRQKMLENNLSLLNEKDIEAMVDRFIEFETKLAKITVPNEQLQNPLDLYNPMSIAELHQKYPAIDWIKFFRHLIPDDASLPEKIILVTPRFMEALNDWVANSPTSADAISTQSMREFLTIKVIMSYIDTVDKKTREAYRKMYSKIASGTVAPPSRARTCISSTSKVFGQLLGRYFVMKNFGGEKQRKQVSEFMDNIKQSWSERLNAVDWLDSETKARALDKVKKIAHKEAYSIMAPDVRSSYSLGEYYASVTTDPSSYFNCQKSARLWNVKNEWKKFAEVVDKAEWYMTPHEVNAYYTPVFNEIVVPAGILQNPFYHSDLPQYLNYGGIGVVIGHEITHAFDNSGRLYDGDGRLNEWWTDATSKAFDSKSQCFIDQYSKFSVKGNNNTEYHVNGKMTLGENLADNGGVNAALMSMRRSLIEEPHKNMNLPQLEHLSPEQLFFINFGRAWCNNIRPEMSLQRIRNDVHSPPRTRVNAAVQNSPEFANAFKCNGQSQLMNPSNKCQICLRT